VCCNKHSRERDYQGRVGKRQPTIAMRRHSRLRPDTRSLHVCRASHEEWSGRWLPICNCCLSSPPRQIQAACQPVPSRHTRVHPMRTLQKHPEQLPTGLIFRTKVNGFDPSKRVVGLQGILRLQLPVKPPGAAGRACHDNVNE